MPEASLACATSKCWTKILHIEHLMSAKRLRLSRLIAKTNPFCSNVSKACSDKSCALYTVQKHDSVPKAGIVDKLVSRLKWDDSDWSNELDIGRFSECSDWQKVHCLNAECLDKFRRWGTLFGLQNTPWMFADHRHKWHGKRYPMEM